MPAIFNPEPQKGPPMTSFFSTFLEQHFPNATFSEFNQSIFAQSGGQCGYSEEELSKLSPAELAEMEQAFNEARSSTPG